METNFSMSPKKETAPKVKRQKATRGLNLAYEPILSAYREFIYANCSNVTESVLGGIPIAIKTILKSEVSNNPIDFLISAIKKYKNTDNFKWRKAKSYSLLAPSKFFSVKFVEDNLIPLGYSDSKQVTKTQQIQEVKEKINLVDKNESFLKQEENRKRIKIEQEKEEKGEIERSIERFDYVEGQLYRMVYKFVDESCTEALSYRIPN